MSKTEHSTVVGRRTTPAGRVTAFTGKPPLPILRLTMFAGKLPSFVGKIQIGLWWDVRLKHKFGHRHQAFRFLSAFFFGAWEQMKSFVV